MEEAERSYRLALEAMDEVGDRRGRGVILDNLGKVFEEQGRLEEAASSLEEAAAILEAVEDRWHLCAVRLHQGTLQLALGRLDAALSLLGEALERARGLGDAMNEGIVLAHLAAAHLEAGEEARAQARLERAYAIAATIGHPVLAGGSRGLLGELALRRGQLEAARGHLEAAEFMLRLAPNRHQLGLLLCRRGHLELAEGRAGAAAAGPA